MKIGIVILNYNCFADTIGCINSIRKATVDLDYKIYVVDNCSTDGSVCEFRTSLKGDKDVVLIALSANNGYANGNNVGIKRAINDVCEVILISNPDVIYDRHAIKSMYSYLINHEVGVVGPLIYNNNGEIDLNAKRTLEYRGFILGKKPCLYIKSRYRNNYCLLNWDYKNPIIFEGMVMGCCFMAKVSILKLTGGFDEGTFLYFEENILGKKFSEEGIKVAIVPFAKIVHKGAGSTHKINSKIYYYKYCSELYGLVNYCKITRAQILLLFLVNLCGFVSTIVKSPCKDNLKLLLKLFAYYFRAIIYRKAGKIKCVG